MKYIKVRWRHEFPDEPIILYSELDEGRWETRKVYVFRSGPAGYASDRESSRSVMLSLEPVPPLDEIASDPQFESHEISEQEFEQIWVDAHSR
jgi:hypothetical protein